MPSADFRVWERERGRPMSDEIKQSHPLRLGFLLSGGGRTLVNLASYLEQHPSLGRIVLVISNRAHAGGVARARSLGFPVEVHQCQQPDESTPIFERFDACKADYVLLGGFLRQLRIPRHWNERVLNIHPSLIPKYCGHGYYGDRVHAAVLAGRELESGCTVHFVDDEYDRGPVILQERVPVLPNDTVETLAQRVFEAECRAYPRALEQLAARGGRAVDHGRLGRASR